MRTHVNFIFSVACLHLVACGPSYYANVAQQKVQGHTQSSVAQVDMTRWSDDELAAYETMLIDEVNNRYVPAANQYSYDATQVANEMNGIAEKLNQSKSKQERQQLSQQAFLIRQKAEMLPLRYAELKRWEKRLTGEMSAFEKERERRAVLRRQNSGSN